MDRQIRREYIRTDSWRVEAKVSEDMKTWFNVEVPDISAGGLMFNTDKLYNVGDILWLEVYINPKMLHIGDINIKSKAVVKSVREVRGGHNAVGVEFRELPKNTQIHLDEVINWTISRYGVFDNFDA